jgi:TnpA family transposase
VPGRIFTPQERKRLDAFPSEIAEADLIRYFILSRSDLDLVRRQRGDQNRIGFALQFCALRYMGFCPDDLEIVPTTALAFVADQLQASPAALHVYGGLSSNWTENRVKPGRGSHFFLTVPYLPPSTTLRSVPSGATCR